MDDAPSPARTPFVVAVLLGATLVLFIAYQWFRPAIDASVGDSRGSVTAPLGDEFAVQTEAGLQAYSAGDFGAAESAFRKAVDAAPEKALGYNNLGSVLIQRGELDEAISVLEKAVSLDPNLEIARNNLRWARSEKDERR